MPFFNKNKCRRVLLLLGCFALPAAHVPYAYAQPVTYSGAAHDALVRDQASDARERALATFQRWLTMEQGPTGAARERVVADYASLLSSSGRHTQALDVANDANFSRLPDYALDALFYSARSVKDVPYLASIVTLTRQRHPDTPLANIRQAYLWFDSGHPDQAHAQAAKVVADEKAPGPMRASASELIGAIEESRGAWGLAIRAYDRALELNPDSRSARRANTYVLGEQRAAPEALREARAANAQAAASGAAPLFTDLEIASLWQQAIGQRTSWAVTQRDVVNGARRHDALNDVLRESDRWLTHYSARSDADFGVLRQRLLIDRIGALNGRGYYRESTDLYERLVDEGVAVPYYGLTPAADSYAQQRRSDRAVVLYEAALADAGDSLQIPSDAHFGLVYAYMDVGRFDDADNLLRRLEEGTPAILRLAPADGTPNPQFTSVSELRARYLLYTDRPGQADPLFASLSGRAPFNESIGDGVGRTAMLRDKTHAALAQAKLVRTDHPDAVAPRVAHAEGLLATGMIREGTAEVEQLEQEYPELGQVRRVALDRDIIHAPYLRVESSFAKGNGNNALSNKDWLVDARLESGLIHDRWRVYARQVSGFADTTNGSARRNRTGLGLMHQRGPWAAEAEVHTGEGPRKQGVAGAVSYRPTDHWVFGLSFDTNTFNLPWRAYNAGVAASRYEARTSYLVNESRRFDLGYQHLRLSDDNVNQGVSASWTERWYSGPISQFQTTLGVGASKNRLTDTAYFSPSSDKSVDLTARYQWLTWKRDDRLFLQRVYASAGSYAQAGFSSSATYGARYEHEWRFRRSLIVTYGIGVAYHPYDGQRERRTLGYLNLAIPFF